MNNITTNTENNINFTSKKNMPKYLYHFTSGQNYQDIIKSGKITMSDGFNTSTNGVFMADLKNLMSTWSKFKHESIDLLTILLSFVSKGEKEIACFKIPTKKMKSKIYIRNQRELIKQGENTNILNFNRYKKHKNYKKPYEFIYKNDIPVSDTVKIPPIEIPEEYRELIYSSPEEICNNLDKYGDLSSKSLNILKKMLGIKNKNI